MASSGPSVASSQRPAVTGVVAWAARHFLDAMRSYLSHRMTPSDQVASVSQAIVLHRRLDRATRYRFSLLHTAHVAAVIQLYDLGDFDEAKLAAEGIIDDCRSLGMPFCVPAIRAHGERARCLRRLDQFDDAIEEFSMVRQVVSEPPAIGSKWLLSYRFDLAITRRDAGDVDGSTSDLRALVPDMVSVFGQDSAWMVATVTQLAMNVAGEGDPETAIDMVSGLLPASTRRRGPLSTEALTLRSKMARWQLADGAGERGRQAASRALIDFTRAGVSSCAEACELRYDYAEALFDCGEVDYAIAQLASLRADLATTRWATSPFAESVSADLDAWRDLHPGGPAAQG